MRLGRKKPALVAVRSMALCRGNPQRWVIGGFREQGDRLAAYILHVDAVRLPRCLLSSSLR